MPVLPTMQLNEWTPDTSDFLSESTAFLQNVLPRGDGYGPMPGFLAYSQPLPGGNDSFTKILLHFGGADASTVFTDSNTGGSSHTWTAVGSAQIDNAQSKFGGTSGLFNGTTDAITTPDSPDFTLGSGDFTFDCWFNCTATTGVNLGLMGQCDSIASTASRSILIERISDVIRVQVWGSSSVFLSGTTHFTNTLNTGWHHLALVRTGNIIKLFIDGVQEGGNSLFSGAIIDSPNLLAIGRLGEYLSEFWQGWIDEVRLSVGIARWTSNFTPPLTSYSIPSACRGFFKAIKTDGSVTVFSGTATGLFELNNSDQSWTDVSRGGLAYSALSSTDNWQFVQYINFVIAVQANEPPQFFDLTSSTAFANLAGSPPQCKYVAVVGSFVVLTGLVTFPYRVQWSSLGDPTGWVAGVNSSSFQDLPDGGLVRGVAGGEYGNIFQDTAIRRLVYAPGSPVIFQIQRISEERGLYAPYSLTRSGDQIFFIGSQGFMQMAPTGYPQPIGKEKVNRTFFQDLDRGALQLCIGASDPQHNRVFFAYKSILGTAGQFDKLLCYDYALTRFTPILFRGEYIGSISQPGTTLENLDNISGSIDALIPSLDSFANSVAPELAVFDINHVLGFFRGPNMEAAVETSAQELQPGRRVFIGGMRPITDAPVVYGAVGSRERLDATEVLTAEQQMDVRGFIPQRASTRIARGKLRIPVGTAWTFVAGLEPDARLEGQQ